MIRLARSDSMAALGGAWARDWQLLVEESSWGGQPLGRSHSVPMVGGRGVSQTEAQCPDFPQWG